MSSTFSVVCTPCEAASNAGGKLHPIPMKLSVCFSVAIKNFYPPIITVGQPTVIVPPWAVMSPCLAAGVPPIITVADPIATVSGGPVHKSISPTLAAGIPPIITVGQPGGRTVPPT
jgi:hypothetical protein